MDKTWNERVCSWVKGGGGGTRTYQQTQPHNENLFYHKDSYVVEQAVQSLSLRVFGIWQDKTLSSLVWPHSWPWLEQEVELETS